MTKVQSKSSPVSIFFHKFIIDKIFTCILFSVDTVVIVNLVWALLNKGWDRGKLINREEL